MRIVYGYVVLIAVIWFLGDEFGWIESKPELIPLFSATVLVMILSNYRFWISQDFVVRMQFGTLLSLGVVASALTVALMLLGGMLLKSAFWVVVASAIGELFLIVMLGRRQRIMVLE